MLNPLRTTAGWLAGRVVLFLLVTALLVATALYRPQLALLGAEASSRIPDAEFVARLERHRAQFQAEALARARDVDARLATSRGRGDAAVEARLRELEALTRAAEARRRTPAQRTLALLTGRGIEQDLRTELDLRLLATEQAAWQQVRTTRALQARELDDLQTAAAAAYARAREFHANRYLPAWERLRALERSTPAWTHGPLNPAWSRLDREHRDALARYGVLLRELEAARAQRDLVRRGRALAVPPVALDPAEFLRPLDEAIAERRTVLATAERLSKAARAALWQALAIVVAITLAPVALKAFWYLVVAPWIARRPPVRLSDRPWLADAPRERERISAVSREIVLRDGEELLVHPEFLQSTADGGRKSTQWLLDRRLPLTSLAARMVALTRVRDAEGLAFVVSSRTDPLAEVGLVEVPAGSAFVLHPRHLVGLVRRPAAPARIVRHWRFGTSAWITLQFRYLVFEGPCTLVVQGTRGVRLEAAGRGRSVDQRATIGFSANLAYAPRRTDTFGAYLLGVRGLFDDHFGGGPGVYVYEELPYAGRPGGLTGRGLEGLTDGVLRALGI